MTYTEQHEGFILQETRKGITSEPFEYGFVYLPALPKGYLKIGAISDKRFPETFPDKISAKQWVIEQNLRD